MTKMIKILALGSLLIGSTLYAADVVDINKEANSAANLTKDDLGNKKEVTEAALGLRNQPEMYLIQPKHLLIAVRDTENSGDMKLVNVKDGKMIKVLKGQNLDNVFQVDFKNKTIVTAGQDRRCAVYGTQDSRAYYKQASFLIYSVGLSPSAKLAGFASDENNNVTIFNTQTKSDLYKLGNHKMTLTNILFINEEELFTSSDSKEINYWKLN